ncbi:MAG: ribbon-helix-helix domain-containing protein [Nitratireductor sp.]
MKKHSITIKGHRTSYSLEELFQIELEKIAAQKNMSLAQLITSIDVKREATQNLSSALRIFILKSVKAENQSAKSQN